MKTLKKTLKTVTIILVIVLTACSTEDGENGKDGAQGPQGPVGTSGNANVIASDWIVTDFDPNPTTFTMFDVIDSDITEDSVNNSVILAYGRNNTFNIATSIPVAFFETSYYFILIPLENKITFVGAALSDYTFEDFEEVRYIFIGINESGAKSTVQEKLKVLSTLKNNGVDISNYNSVATYYDLES